jgi:hypothetical protein
VTPDVVAKVRELNPNVSIVSIPDVGHLIRFDKYTAFMDALRAFLKQIRTVESTLLCASPLEAAIRGNRLEFVSTNTAERGTGISGLIIASSMAVNSGRWRSAKSSRARAMH